MIIYVLSIIVYNFAIKLTKITLNFVFIFSNRFQPYISDDFGPKASASINVVSAVLPNSLHSNHDQFFDSSPIHNGFGGSSPIHNGFGSYDNKFKFVDTFAKDIRWEYGFKPPLVPSVAIDSFGNPLNEH